MSRASSTLTFLDAAYAAIEQVGKPLTVREILQYALENNLLSTNGTTPYKTMNARLAVDILRRKSQSRFMRSDGSRFSLRVWNETIPEKVVARRKTALFDEEILAFDANLLRLFLPQDGLKRGDDHHHRLLASCFPVQRSKAELRFDIIQLVSVYVVRHYQQFISYKRSKRLPEQRLHHSYSCFFGGHLTSADLMPLFRFSDPEQALFLLDRELSEELRLPSRADEITFKGLLYDPRSEVSRQHIGIVFCVDVRGKTFEIGEKGFLTDAKFESIQEMEARIEDFENWSQHLIQNEIRQWN